MTCTTIRLPDGSVAIVCGPRSRARNVNPAPDHERPPTPPGPRVKGFADDRIQCSECTRLKQGRCLAYRELGASQGYRPVVQPRRCSCFVPLASMADQRTGAQRWPWLKC